jgi:hypothetical protein
MSASTLLTDAFAAARAYWAANNVGTRAGLIAHLVATVGVTTTKATAWVDAITKEVFDIGVSDGTAYADFKTRVQAIGVARANRALKNAFAGLSDGQLLQDAKDQAVAFIDTRIAAANADIAVFTTLRADVAAEPPSADRDNSLVAIDSYLGVLARKVDALLRDRDRAAGL